MIQNSKKQNRKKRHFFWYKTPHCSPFDLAFSSAQMTDVNSLQEFTGSVLHLPVA